MTDDVIRCVTSCLVLLLILNGQIRHVHELEHQSGYSNPDILYSRFDGLVLTLKFLSVLLAFSTWFLAQSVRN